MNKKWFKKFGIAFKKSTTGFLSDNGLKLSAALAYYTIFSIPPLLIIIITLLGFVFEKEAVEGTIHAQLAGLIGSNPALQVQEAIKNTPVAANLQFANIISIAALIFGATGVFAEMQDSINLIWGLKAKPKKGLIKFLFNRLLSFSMLISLGFILLVSLSINALVEIMNNKLKFYFPEITVYIFYVVNIVITFGITSLLFASIFKLLPDAKIKWRDVFTGSMFTALLFMIGKFAIGLYLGKSDVGSAYGAAGSIIIILVWVYYSSIILFFGAEFTQVYAFLYGCKIIPSPYAVIIEKNEIEKVPEPGEEIPMPKKN